MHSSITISVNVMNAQLNQSINQSLSLFLSFSLSAEVYTLSPPRYPNRRTIATRRNISFQFHISAIIRINFLPSLCFFFRLFVYSFSSSLLPSFPSVLPSHKQSIQSNFASRLDSCRFASGYRQAPRHPTVRPGPSPTNRRPAVCSCTCR